MNDALVALITERAWTRILADRAEGVIPPDGVTFDDLHTYVDANMYLLDDGGNFDAETDGWEMDRINEHMNAAMDALDARLSAAQ